MPKTETIDRLEPRKLPAQRRAAATVDAILEAAAHILERHGLDGYSTNAIAERAGASIGSLYQYFPNKTAITRALIVREMTRLRDCMFAIGDDACGRIRLRRLIDEVVDDQMRRPALALLLDVEEARLPGDDRLLRLSEEMATVFHDILDASELPAGANTSHVIDDLMAIICGMVKSAATVGRTERLADRVAAAVFGYLGIPQVVG